MSGRSMYAFGDFLLNPGGRQLTRAGTPVPITPKAFDVLLHFVTRPGQVVSKEELLSAVWPDSFVEESNLSQHVFALRRALKDCASYIATIPGRGYQFVEPVRLVEAELEETSLPATPAAVAAPHWFQRPWFRQHRVAASSIAVALLFGSMWGAWMYRRASVPSFHRLLIADFSSSTGNPLVDDALRQALEIGIGQSPHLEVMGRPEALALLKQMGRDADTRLVAETAREVCVRGNRQVLLESSVVPLGTRYRLSISARSCADGSILGGDTREVGRQEELLRALDGIAAHIRKQLGESARDIQDFDVPLEQATTSSLEALKSYSLAKALSARGAEAVSLIPLYQRAVELDPRFAMGYQSIANLYYESDEPVLAATAARQAYLLSGRVTERERFAIQIHFHADAEQDLISAINTAREWATSYPHDWMPWLLMAGEYNDLGLYPPAIDAGRKALALADDQAVIYSVLVRAERRANHFAEVKHLGQLAMQHHADGPGLHATLWMTALVEHDDATLQREAAWGDQHGGWFHHVCLAEAAAQAGRLREYTATMNIARSEALTDRLTETNDVLAVDMGLVYAAFGQPEDAVKAIASVKHLGFSDQADLVVLQASLGVTAPAEEYLFGPRTAAAFGTIHDYADVPRVRAALAMAQGQPQAAVEILQSATRYELIEFKIPVLRAEAYRRAGQLAAAEAEYRRIIASPGIDPTSVYLALAHLQLGRIYAQRHDYGRAHSEYEALFAIWRSADADLPLLLQARREAATLP